VKYRVVDLLRCTCGGSLILKNAVSLDVPFEGSFDEVRCQEICAFKQVAVREANDLRPRDCVECYGQEVSEGDIRCTVCGKTWPVVDGIPRVMPDALATDVKKAQDTFSYEWKMFQFGERNWGQDIEFRKELFLDALGASVDDLRGKLIFDAGCGSGALSIEMAKSFGMEVIALDLAYGVERAYAHNDSPYVHFFQGSVLDPPFRDQAFDYLYCAGVLVATPNTFEGFKAIIRTLKVGGRCFIWVYHPITKRFYPRTYPKLAAYNWIRVHVTSRLPIRLQYWLFLSTIPLFLAKQSVELRLGRRSTRLTWREKMQALFDFFSPKYQHRHEPAEVRQWYAETGFENVAVCNEGTEGFGVRGDRVRVGS
jgi:ubiquinone/menaquinone biosynthesis C-methylase UbiE/uncharacterized protein YbaR (Trm112 family)